MYQVAKNIYINFTPQQSSVVTQNQKVRGLIMGYTGNGKTYFINNMCNTNYQVGIQKASMTRDIAFEDVHYIAQSKFRIYDTPGSNSSQDALEHALVLRASLTNLPLNLIMIQAKFSSRYVETLAEFKQQIKIFKGYQSMVVLLISHGDLLQQQKNRQKTLLKIGDTLKQYEFTNKVIIYSNISSDFQSLSNILYKIGQCNKPQKIQISQKTFFRYFKLSNPINGLNTKQVDQYVWQIKNIAEDFLDLGKQILKKQNEDIDELSSQLKLFMKYYLKKKQYQQYKVYEVGYNQDKKSVDVYLMISQYIQTKLQELDELFDYKLKKVIYNEYNKKYTELVDLFRACPRCKEIWMLVKGCDGDTTCGYKAYYYDYQRYRQLYRYEFQYEGDRLVYRKKSEKKVGQKIQQSSKSENQYFKFNINIPEGNIGCGMLISWKNQPRIQGIEQKLKNIFKVSNFQEIKLQLMGIQKNKVNLMKKLSQKVQSSIKIMEEDKLIQVKNDASQQRSRAFN